MCALISILGLGNQQCQDVKTETDPKVDTNITPSGGKNNQLPSDVRIPTKLYPLHYNVELQPHIYRFDVNHLTLRETCFIFVNSQFCFSFVCGIMQGEIFFCQDSQKISFCLCLPMSQSVIYFLPH